MNPIRNEIMVARDFFLRPLCALGRHREKAIRPGVYECQRAWCTRELRKVKAEMDPAAEAHAAQVWAWAKPILQEIGRQEGRRR